MLLIRGIIINQTLELTGSFEGKIDPKGRLLIPVALKQQMGSIINEQLVLKRGVFDKCLELYPLNEWRMVMKNVGKLNRFKKENNDFIRRWMAGARLVSLDGANRLLIPKILCQYAELSKEVVLSSGINILEIWNKVHYEQNISLSTNAFSKLAERVMGSPPIDE